MGTDIIRQDKTIHAAIGIATAIDFNVCASKMSERGKFYFSRMGGGGEDFIPQTFFQRTGKRSSCVHRLQRQTREKLTRHIKFWLFLAAYRFC